MSAVYNIAKLDSLTSGINYQTDTIRVMLVKPTYSFIGSDQFVSQIVAAECVGANYVRKTLQNKTVAVNNFLNKSIFTADNVTWNFINAGAINSAVIYKQVTNDADSVLIACFTVTPANYMTGGGIFTIKWSNSGILTVS